MIIKLQEVEGRGFDAKMKASLKYVRDALPTGRILEDGIRGISGNGATILIPAGDTFSMDQIEVPHNCFIKGESSRSTVIHSAFNGSVFRNKVEQKVYTHLSGGISGIRIVGDRRLDNQTGISLLRTGQGFRVFDVEVSSIGRNGIELFESVGSTIEQSRVRVCGKDAYSINGGIKNWNDRTPTNLPSNAVSMFNCEAHRNDGYSINMTDTNGARVIGGYYQYAFSSSGLNKGYGVRVGGNGFGNVIQTWIEGEHDAHILIDTNSASDSCIAVLVDACNLIISKNTNRAIFAKKGACMVRDIMGNNESYPEINGSSAPFRVNKDNATGPGRIFYQGPRYSMGFGRNGESIIEDENGSDQDLRFFASYEYQRSGYFVKG